MPPGSSSTGNNNNQASVQLALQSSSAPRDPSGNFTDEEILEAFQAFDLDKNNFVGAAEIRHVLINIGTDFLLLYVQYIVRPCFFVE